MKFNTEINGDDTLSLGKRLLYLAQNFWKNIAFCSNRLPSHNFFSQRLGSTSRGASPNRVLTEAFFVKQVPKFLAPGPIKVLDIGCGSGQMSELLAQAGFTGSYTGIDIEDRFTHSTNISNAFKRIFILGDAHNLPEDQSFDLILSSSALEHIENDVALVEKLGRMTSQEGMQVHLVPGSWSLPLYLWHGWRQYTLCSISKRVCPDRTLVYKMGGIASFLLHFICITLSEVILHIPFRKWFPNVYGLLLDAALHMDRFLPFGAPFLAVCQRPDRSNT
ncbi:MAG: class I SAM-dependent methyltransferase [Rhodospirillales bacterium]|nr:class I SAM-dependent methyltransferase [Rhodospirillales bacterium]